MNSRDILNLVGEKTGTKRVVRRFGLRITKVDNVDYFTPLLNWLLRKRGRLFFVQIGANDGRSGDPLHATIMSGKGRMDGIAVEPLADAFAALKKTYSKRPGIKLVNAAIHNSAVALPIFRVSSGYRGKRRRFAYGIASFDKGHLRDVMGIPEEFIKRETVACISLEDLLEQNGWPNVDVLQIDTEGYDLEILQGIDFSKIKPNHPFRTWSSKRNDDPGAARGNA